MIEEGQRSLRSQVSYVSLVVVLVATALIVAVGGSPPAAALVGGLGLVWTALALRSGIEVDDEGLRVRGLVGTRRLAWAEIDACVVTGPSGRSPWPAADVEYAPPAAGALGAGVALGGEAVRAAPPPLSMVAVLTRTGERLRVVGTASTPLDPEFPAHAAAELNRVLARHGSRLAAV